MPSKSRIIRPTQHIDAPTAARMPVDIVRRYEVLQCSMRAISSRVKPNTWARLINATRSRVDAGSADTPGRV